MKKRAMKKWIPKNTLYCDGCKWWQHTETKKLHKNPPSKDFSKCVYADDCKYKCWTDSFNSCQMKIVRCNYLGCTDEYEDTLLWDKVKECGVSEAY